MFARAVIRRGLGAGRLAVGGCASPSPSLASPASVQRCPLHVTASLGVKTKDMAAIARSKKEEAERRAKEEEEMERRLEDGEDEEDDDDDGYDDWEDKEGRVTTYRLDAVAKVIFNRPRKVIEELVPQGKVLLNDAPALKKAVDIKEGDQLEMVKFADRENPALFHLARAVVRGCPSTKDRKTNSYGITWRYWHDVIVHQDDLPHLAK